MYIRIILLLLVTLCIGQSFAKDKDSLWAVWKNTALHDSLRATAINDYAWSYRSSYPDSAIYFGRMAWNFAIKTKNPKNQDAAINTIGIGHMQNAAFDSATYYFELGFNNAASRVDLKRMGAIKVNIATIYAMQDKLMYALDNLNEGVVYLEKAQDTVAVFKAKFNIGIVYRKLGEYESALEIYRSSLTEAIKYGVTESEALAYNNIANIHQLLGDHDSSVYYYRLALPINIRNNDNHGEARIYQNLSSAYLELGFLDSAYYYAHRSLAIQNRLGDLHGQTGSFILLGNVMIEKTRLDSALYYAESALKNATALEALEDQFKSHDVMFRVYRAKGNYKMALDHFITKIQLKDSIASSENLKSIAQQEMKYEYRKQKEADELAHAQEIILLEKERENQEALAKEAETRNVIVIIGVSVVLFLVAGLAFVLYRSNLQKKKDNNLITEQKNAVEQQKMIVEEKNHEITDSINYARRIQSAILPPVKLIAKHLPESFVLYLPKDIVAGDFYWFHEGKNFVHLAVADCTGHGVPGALVSVVCHNALTRSVREFGYDRPNEILDKTRDLVVETFEKSEEDVKDGMDISLCSVSVSSMLLNYSGANNPMYLVRRGELTEIKADKQPVGKYEHAKPFTRQEQPLQKGDVLYLFSDGFADQFGGPKGKKLKYSSLKDFLITNCNRPMKEQHRMLEEYFGKWKGALEQVDDVCIIGFRI